MPEYREIEFNALDEKTRTRFVDCLSGGTPSPILLRTRSTGGAAFGWACLAFLAFSGLVVFLQADFGRASRHAQELGFVVAYAVCLFLLLWSVLRLVRTIRLSKALPFKRGRYLFPLDFVVAETSKLRIVPMGALINVGAVHRHVNGAYQATDINLDFEAHGRETFTIHGMSRAEARLTEMRIAHERVSDAIANQDFDTLYALDPFAEARTMAGWNDATAAAHAQKFAAGSLLAQPTSGLLERAALLSLTGLLLAPLVLFARNYASDESAFASLASYPEVYAAEAYLRNGGHHVAEVRDHYLPEAAFVEAQRTGTVTALRDFVRAYPMSPRAQHARGVIHQRFEQVRETFLGQASQADPRMPTFMAQLLAYLEAHDSPPVQVRFAAPSSASLAEIDQNLGVLGDAPAGGIAPVAPHFSASLSGPREGFITRSLQQGFEPIFPADVMSLEQGPAIAGDDKRAGPVPSLDVSYEIRPSGAVYESSTSNRGFVGIYVTFHIEMRIPE
ncbi:MAG: hypothetical protein OEY14_17650, partial [Myxococcales bacterium]|nr:hypothetical protein [Myxococcales bacterium]